MFSFFVNPLVNQTIYLSNSLKKITLSSIYKQFPNYDVDYSRIINKINDNVPFFGYYMKLNTYEIFKKSVF